MLIFMKRTTIAFDDALFSSLRQRAAKESRPLKAVVDSLLRQALAPRKARPYKCAWRVVKGRGLLPGVNLEDRDSLLDRMEDR